MNDPFAYFGPRLKSLLQRPATARALSFATGIFAAIMVYYFVYRIEVPTTPFIYVSF